MNTTIITNEELEVSNEILKKIRANLNHVLVGQDDTISFLLTALICGGHVLLQDTPGTGKTVMAKSLARSVDGSFSRIQFTPDLLPSDVTGLYYYNQKDSEFCFRPGPVFSNILLADEINRATPRTQSALLECMEERQVTIDGNTHTLEAPFFVMATQNPIETAGTFALPEAQLDRFMMQLSMAPLSREEELSVMKRFMNAAPLEELSSVCTKEELLSLSKLYSKVFVHPLLMEYIADIVRATREDSAVIAGVSPRGTLAFLKAVQAYALLSGRGYAVPEDVKALAEVVLAHRIITTRGYGNEEASNKLVRRILATLPAPTENFTRR